MTWTIYQVKQYVNGKLANVGTNPSPDEGKILFQSEVPKCTSAT